MTATQQPPVVRHRVVPFSNLTPAERAEHMVDAHGFNEDWFAADEPGNYEGIPADRYPTRAEALAYWTRHPLLADGEHDDDHDPSGDFDGVGGGVPHTHTKPPTRACDCGGPYEGPICPAEAYPGEDR